MALQRRQWITGSLLLAVGAARTWAQPADAAAAEAKAPPLPPLGAPWTVPAMDLLDGGRFEPAQADGQLLVLYWWASTCPFCAATTPHLNAFWQRHRQQPGWQLLTLSIDRTREAAQRYLQQRGYAFPCVWVTPQVQRAMPKPKGLPVTLVRGRDGRILMAERGQLFKEDIDAIAQWL
ncbi:Thiol-disulfide oxidoreductase ResA [Tepidimonas alkaliphilus]|uniref:Thiol-disulfide oxidoreductase ResA n=1 Tax=Tepidimonas alkaliphilus TaxID=2588942 RepID=A0A554WDJ2_9BURK|nr:TlpA disulfide reductase family protein [Tepidimonas alkaliphilus]TSE21648.1 Thiol-disulfide oxidoreductase ResA [Tepidimonas alkaliphilus]